MSRRFKKRKKRMLAVYFHDNDTYVSYSRLPGLFGLCDSDVNVVVNRHL